jgi:hypothetical protein
MRPCHKNVEGWDSRTRRQNLCMEAFAVTLTMDMTAWAENQFGHCDLKDKRRTNRLVRLADEVIRHPAGSLPEQTTNTADLKAAYRLFDCPDVTFDRVAGPHWEQTHRQSPGRYLLIDDTTEVAFGICREISGLGPTGNAGGRGFWLHSALMASAESEEIFGLAGQKIWYRKLAPTKENTSQRLARKRESELWGVVIVKKELGLPLPLYTILPILSLIQFEKTPLIEALSCESYKTSQPNRPNQLVLFEYRSDINEE